MAFTLMETTITKKRKVKKEKKPINYKWKLDTIKIGGGQDGLLKREKKKKLRKEKKRTTMISSTPWKERLWTNHVGGGEEKTPLVWGGGVLSGRTPMRRGKIKENPQFIKKRGRGRCAVKRCCSKGEAKRTPLRYTRKWQRVCCVKEHLLKRGKENQGKGVIKAAISGLGTVCHHLTAVWRRMGIGKSEHRPHETGTLRIKDARQ